MKFTRATLYIILTIFLTFGSQVVFIDSIHAEPKNTNANSNSNTPATNSNTPATNGPSGKADVDTTVTFGNIPDFDKSLGTLFNPLGDNTDSVPKLIAQGIRILLAIVAGLSVIVIIVAGFRMVLSNGNEAQITAGKQALTWAIIGLVVSLLSFSLVSLVQRVI